MKYSKIDQFLPRYSILSSIILVFLLSSCSTTGSSKNDPLEPMNRAIFQFNEVVDDNIFEPVAKTYKYITDFPDYKTSSTYKRILATNFDESDKIKFTRACSIRKNAFQAKLRLKHYPTNLIC